MKAHETFQKMPRALAVRIFTYLQTHDKAIYKAAIQGLAQQRKLRAVFVERKVPNERFAWMQNALGRPMSDGVAAHLLQAWLLSAHKEMLCQFLDAFEIPHSEDGTAENIPPAPPKEKIAAAIDGLLAKYPADEAALYLHAFQGMEGGEQWAPLGEILRDDPRLQFAPNE